MLQQHVRNFPDRIALEVNQKLAGAADAAADRISTKFKSANEMAEQARVNYERAANFAAQRVAYLAMASFALGCLGMTAGVAISAKFILPDPDIIQRAREAERVVEILTPKGGNSILNTCTSRSVTRTCVRTDEAGSERYIGSRGETYRILYGY